MSDEADDEIPALHCEVKKYAYRQSKDGHIVSFVIHPNDMPKALANAPIGTCYQMAFAEYAEDEKPKQ